MYINKYHGSYNIQKRTTSIKYIVLHYVGSGTSAAGSAKANCIYFSRGNRNASAHYFVDDGGIWEYANPSTYATWHCGDGHGAYGITNSNSIGVEVCINGDKPYTAKEISYLKQLIPYLMKTYGVPASRVVRHYDASRKMCPYYYARRSAEWTKLKNTITGSSTSTSTTTKPSSSTTKPAAAPKKTVLAVDGSFGPASIKRMQQFFGTTPDGIISGQYESSRKYFPGIPAAYVTWTKTGSYVVKKLQKWVGSTQDGYLGPNTIKGLQRKLGISADGYWGPGTSKAFQKYLNNH